MQKCRLFFIEALFLVVVVMVVYLSLGPVVTISHAMAKEYPSLAPYRAWILMMAWIILAGIASSAGILFFAVRQIRRLSLFQEKTIIFLKGAAKSLEVSQIAAGILILLFLSDGIFATTLIYLMAGLVFSLIVTQTLRLLADVIRAGIIMEQDISLTI